MILLIIIDAYIGRYSNASPSYWISDF